MIRNNRHCEHVFPEIFRENHFSVFLAVLDELLLTSVQVWEKNSDFKKTDKIVDTVTLIRTCNNFKSNSICTKRDNFYFFSV